MHSYPINASIQLVPINLPHLAMPQIDEVIGIIRQSGLSFEVGPFGTSVCGAYQEVMSLVNTINSHLAAHSKTEWVLNLQMHIKPNSGVTPEEKTAKHR